MNSKTLDIAAISQKYREEREKRLARGNRNSIDPVGRFHEFDSDPFGGPSIKRDPIREDVDVLVTGGGISGLLVGRYLKKYGITNFRMLDDASDFGGTWYWNRYPGVRCDVESYVYLPLLEEVGTVPKERYSTGKEILEHCQALGRRFGLYEHALFQTRITSVIWDEAAARWIVATNRGDELRARFVAASSGFLHYPKYPDIPGIETFEGKMFHPGRWDFDYTGGRDDGQLTKLKGKRIALIGTGATGIQILPHVAQFADRVYLVQRTPGAVDARNNQPTDTEWFTSQEPGWQAQRQENFHATIAGEPVEDMIDDCWTRASKQLFERARQYPRGNRAAAVQMHDYELMDRLRSRIEEVVADEKTAEQLKPWYNLFCKRPLYADDYLESFNLPSVTLVDTDGRGVDEISESGLVVNGDHYEVDCIIIASGYQIGAYGPETSTYPIVGRDGRQLSYEWAKGLKSIHGLWIAGFPNFQFVGNLNQAAATFNYTYLAQEQAEHAAELFAKALSEGVDVMEVTPEGVANWAEALAKAAPSQSFYDECTPSYFNNEGNTSETPVYQTAYGGGAKEYISIIRNWRSGGHADELIMRKSGNA